MISHILAYIKIIWSVVEHYMASDSNSIHPDPAPHAPTSLLPIFTAIFIFESYLCNESNISHSVSFIIFKCRCYRVLRSDQGG